MIKDYQVTLFCTTKEFRPVSCIVKREELDLTNRIEKSKLIQEGATKICIKRSWSGADLQRYHYTKAKVREYNQEQEIDKKLERYHQIMQKRKA